jgi:PAS domain S-box-containing protein
VAENAALVELAETMSSAPQNILQTLTDVALKLCEAHSAGVSLLEDADRHARCHWRAIAGQWAAFVGGGTPRDFGPCGTVLDLNEPLLFSHPERDFPYFGDATPAVEDSLLVPFYVDGKPLGTIWVVAHDDTKRFDAEDLRVMSNLSKFASAAYQTTLATKARETANELLRTAADAAERFSFIVESSDDAIIGKTLEGIITSWNKSAQRIFGYSAEEAIGKNITLLIPADRIDEEKQILDTLQRGERVAPFDTIRIQKSGEQVHVSVTVSPIRDLDGMIVGASKIARDISQRISTQDQQALLMREMRHRVNNLFLVTNAIVSLSARSAANPTEMARSVQDRLFALTRAHALARPGLVDAGNSPHNETSLRSLILTIFEPYYDAQSRAPGRVRFEGPDLQISEQFVTNMALVLHEFATNSAKYGALSNVEGLVRISSSLESDSLSLIWSEEGGPVIEGPPTHEGFGGSLTRQVVVNQFKGTLNPEWRPRGLVLKIQIPLAHLSPIPSD